MPSAERVASFMATVEAGQYVEAIVEYYHPAASMQENQDPPREGRDTLVAHEKQVMKSFASIRCKRLAEPAISGDLVAILWRFTFSGHDGSVKIMNEVAWQSWQGEHIAREQFFYDPRQMLG